MDFPREKFLKISRTQKIFSGSFQKQFCRKIFRVFHKKSSDKPPFAIIQNAASHISRGFLHPIRTSRSSP
jgi:hypothetical protein